MSLAPLTAVGSQPAEPASAAGCQEHEDAGV
jgi:hypothetical protein